MFHVSGYNHGIPGLHNELAPVTEGPQSTLNQQHDELICMIMGRRPSARWPCDPDHSDRVTGNTANFATVLSALYFK